MGVSKKNGTPKSSILIGFSIINHPFWGTPIFGNTQIFNYIMWLQILSLNPHWAPGNLSFSWYASPKKVLWPMSFATFCQFKKVTNLVHAGAKFSYSMTIRLFPVCMSHQSQLCLSEFNHAWIPWKNYIKNSDSIGFTKSFQIISNTKK